MGDGSRQQSATAGRVLVHAAAGPAQTDAATAEGIAAIDRLEAAVPAALAMLAGQQLGVFTRLSGRRLAAAELAAEMGVEAARLDRLLRALVVAGLLVVDGEAYANAPGAEAVLVEGRPGYRGGHDLTHYLWRVDLETARSITSGRPAAAHDYAAVADEEMEAFLRRLHPYASAAGRDLAARLDLSAFRSAIDVGGGTGGLVAALCTANPQLRGALFELPRNVRLAGRFLATTPGGERVTLETGDIVAAPPAGVHDLVVMRALVQVLGPQDAARAIANAAAATAPGGRLVILGGGVLDDDRLGPPAAVYLDVTFLNLYEAGGAYTEARHAAWLAAAGCHDVERTVLPTGASMIVATKGT